MKRLLLVFGILCIFATAAEAAVVSDLVMGQVNLLEDDDWEVALDAGNDISGSPSTTLDVNDFLVGMLRITALEVPAEKNIQSYGATEATFSAVFAVKVTGRTDVGGGLSNYTFTNASDAEWGTLGLKALGFDPVVDGTAVIVFDDPDNIDPTMGSVATSLATVDGTLLWELGFDGDTDLFWIASLVPYNPSAGTSLFTAASWNLALNMTYDGAGPPLVPFLIDPDDASLGDAQIVGSGPIRKAFSSAVGWQVKSDADLLIMPTPEPNSLLVWGALLGLGAFWYRRRK